VTASTDPSGVPFPPQSIEAFLNFCAGDWLSLRSRFRLQATGEAADDADDDGWHHSERGELRVTYLAAEQQGEPGGLEIRPPAGGAAAGQGQRLQFTADGRFHSQGAGGSDSQGHWQLWPDGSLELSSGDGQITVTERIWFTKPNLRLRSCVEQRTDGRPGRASFSSEIRRLTAPSP
jgi:hypothetical protein